ncbi:MAG: hypothetical protein ACFWUD_00240 [Thermocaproicibacter melissae]|uniref:hypothetical protein n=2 Tax=Thermocaproicibacter melissae TaxID=2966552 RepID=UPI0024B05AC0|nr:hypothetical protein [Thermocaproicibacter melissae]WBY64995.1 hypothetical protein NOG13_04715 [Thermocaproicibacter melissae]
MSIMDLKTRYSINYPMCFDCVARERLVLGYCKMIYLYFTLPCFNSLCKFPKAELILFQYPCASRERVFSNEDDSKKDCYFLYPLLKPLNIFYRLAPTEIDRKHCVSFQVSRMQSHVTIDITKIFQDWMNGKLANSGLLLIAPPTSKEVAFASGQFDLPWMRPTIRLDCDFKGMLPCFCSAPCEVKVAGVP